MADLVAGTWRMSVGVLAGATSANQKVNATVHDYMASDAGKRFLRELGMQPIGGTPAEAATFIAAEAARCAPLIRETHMVTTE